MHEKSKSTFYNKTVQIIIDLIYIFIVLFTLMARKQQARRKRREEAPGGRRPGGSNTNPGNS